MSHVTLETICCEREDAKAINVIYLIVDALSLYNIILERPIINTL